MKTIFITIFQGAEAKNILRTDIYRKLIANPELRLVFFVGDENRGEYYKKEFNHERVIYEVAPTYNPKLADKIMDFLRFKLIKTKTLDLRRKMALEDGGGYLAYLFSFFINRIIANRLVRKIVRELDYFFAKQNEFAPFFEKYKPDLIFLAHLFDSLEIAMLREAKKRNIYSIGFINSWDKLTARGMIRLLPNKLVVFNEIVRKEALDFADMKSKDIFISGIPQYDQYINSKLSSRHDFYKKVGIDPVKRILVYAPMGKYFSNSDWDIIDLLHEWFAKKLLPEDSELLVRFQPNDFLDEEEIKKRPWLIYDYPGVRFSKKRGVDWDMSFADLQHLTDTLNYASLFVCYATSLSIDAAIFDKPVINIGFEVKEKQKLSQTPTHFYKTAHYKKAATTGGIRFVKSPEELLEWIKKYLEHPELDSEGRKRLVQEQCWRTDGRAGERIANFIISNASRN
jgi:hypothetical protein